MYLKIVVSCFMFALASDAYAFGAMGSNQNSGKMSCSLLKSKISSQKKEVARLLAKVRSKKSSLSSSSKQYRRTCTGAAANGVGLGNARYGKPFKRTKRAYSKKRRYKKRRPASERYRRARGYRRR